MRRLWQGIVMQQVGFIPACLLVTGALCIYDGMLVRGLLAFGTASAVQVALYR